MHPSKYKFEHPRFCLERLEYVGQKIQVDFTNMLIQLSILYCVCCPIMFENKANCLAWVEYVRIIHYKTSLLAGEIIECWASMKYKWNILTLRLLFFLEHLSLSLPLQDLVMAERLLMKHLDAPGRWLQEKHRRILMNKFCGRYLRDKHLHRFIIYGESVQDKFEHNRRLRNPATTAVQQAIHGLAYTVYGKPEVRRLMFEVFDVEQIQPKAVWASNFVSAGSIVINMEEWLNVLDLDFASVHVSKSDKVGSIFCNGTVVNYIFC